MILRLSLALVVAAGVASVAGAARTTEHADPTWSPDGTQIAYTAGSSGRSRLVVATASGNVLRTLYSSADGCCDPIRWAAGNRIVFASNYHVMSVPSTGGKPITLTDQSDWYILSPDRGTVAFVDGCDCGHAPDAIGLVDARGGSPTIIPKPDNATDSIDGFSPDGTELVFTRYPFDKAGPSTVMVASVKGGMPGPVALGSSGLIGAAHVPAGAERVQWSPDGKWIAFVRNLRLEVVSTSGGTARVLATKFGAHAFSWSPKSNRIAFDQSFGKNPPAVSNSRLVTVDPRGRHRVVLWRDPALHYLSNFSIDWPQWSSDGSKLIFMAIRGPGRPPAHIWVVGANGRGLKRIT